MDSFHTFVLIAALSILIIMLTYFGIILFSNSKQKKFPPTQADCPDNWTVDGTKCIVPTNGNNVGTFPKTSSGTPGYASGGKSIDGKSIGEYFDNSNSGWNSNGKSSLCNKKLWANKYNVVWDGIDNSNVC